MLQASTAALFEFGQATAAKPWLLLEVGSTKIFCPAQASTAALTLFEFGQAEAAKRGLLLVDTKYEMGKTPDGRVLLIDEVRKRRQLLNRQARWLH